MIVRILNSLSGVYISRNQKQEGFFLRDFLYSSQVILPHCNIQRTYRTIS